MLVFQRLGKVDFKPSARYCLWCGERMKYTAIRNATIQNAIILSNITYSARPFLQNLKDHKRFRFTTLSTALKNREHYSPMFVWSVYLPTLPLFFGFLFYTVGFSTGKAMSDIPDISCMGNISRIARMDIR